MRSGDARLRESFLHEVRRRRAREAGPHALLLLAPDGFSRFEDALGHERAARLLLGIAQRLALCFPELASGPVGEHEFALLVPLARADAQLPACWNELHALLALPFSGEWGEASLRFSAGFARLPGDGSEPGQVLDAALASLHQAQASGGGRCLCFQSGFLREARERIELERALRLALERRELRVHYQPIVHCATGALRGLEALLRWDDPRRGRIAPERFVRLAEETGLIHELGAFALREVLAQRARWRRAGGVLAQVQVSLNVSARQLDDDRFVRALERAAAEGELAGPALWLELTETALVADCVAARARLERLHALGLRLALDDLGTGYSSLLELRSLPLDGLKLDRRLMAGVGSDPLSTRLFEAVCALAHGIPLCLVVEGIETPVQLAALRRQGCTLAQGFLWSPALCASELEQWTANRFRHSA